MDDRYLSYRAQFQGALGAVHGARAGALIEANNQPKPPEAEYLVTSPVDAIGGERMHPLQLRHSQSGLPHLTPYLGFPGIPYSFPDNTSRDTSCRSATALSSFGILVSIAGPRNGMERLVDHHGGLCASTGLVCVCLGHS